MQSRLLHGFDLLNLNFGRAWHHHLVMNHTMLVWTHLFQLCSVCWIIQGFRQAWSVIWLQKVSNECSNMKTSPNPWTLHHFLSNTASLGHQQLPDPRNWWSFIWWWWWPWWSHPTRPSQCVRWSFRSRSRCWRRCQTRGWRWRLCWWLVHVRLRSRPWGWLGRWWHTGCTLIAHASRWRPLRWWPLWSWQYRCCRHRSWSCSGSWAGTGQHMRWWCLHGTFKSCENPIFCTCSRLRRYSSAVDRLCFLQQTPPHPTKKKAFQHQIWIDMNIALWPGKLLDETALA